MHATNKTASFKPKSAYAFTLHSFCHSFAWGLDSGLLPYESGSRDYYGICVKFSWARARGDFT